MMPRPPNSKKQQSNTSSDEHIPRPPNCFILFRADYLRCITDSTPEVGGSQQQKEVSLEAAAAWKVLPPEDQEHYRALAKAAKEEHARMHPGWVYKPAPRKKVKVADDDDPPVKCAPRNCKTTSGKKSSTKAEGGRGVTPTPPNRDPAPMELVWDSSWFSGTAPMTDPFYSAPFQPLTSVSTHPDPLHGNCSFRPKDLCGSPPDGSSPPPSPLLHGPHAWLWHGKELLPRAVHIRSKPKFREWRTR